MKILNVLTYYRPHTSGLTIYAERLVKALARRGHQVTVLTTQFEKNLPRQEIVEGVRIIRLPVVARVNKGVLAPSFGFVAAKMVREYDVVLMHLPQFDAAIVAFLCWLFNRPGVILYTCDLLLPAGLFNRFVNRVVDFMNNLAGIFSKKVVAYTEDFAVHSPYLTRFARKREVILPNVQIPQASPDEVAAFQEQHNPERQKIIGMATRFASEKGVEILLDALPTVLARFPQAKVLFAGQFQGVWGEEAYAAALMPRIQKYQQEGQWEFLGVLSMQEMAVFFPNLDVLVVPSLNSTETFGFVQIEAMMNGTPAVASNLPGVRVPVTMTGMGKIVPIGDAPALAAAILDVLEHPEAYRGDPLKIRQMFHPDTNAAAFEKLFHDLLQK